METVKPRELQLAARLAEALVYTTGVAGVIAGGLLFREGQAGFALVAWTLTFTAGAALRIAAYAARALADLLVRQARMEERFADLATAEGRPESGGREGPPDPYRRWGGHH